MIRAATRVRLAAGLVLLGLAAGTPSLAAGTEDSWDDLQPRFFGNRPIVEDHDLVAIDAPNRAEDAALVPVDLHVTVPASDPRTVVALTLVVDENPSPLVTTLRFGAGTRRFDVSTRLRVNSYSYVRVIAEASDGTLHMVKAYVKAAGGCSAPAVKDPAEADAEAGKMRFRVFSDTGHDEAQLQIRHPNYSGMQMNQLTRLYTPAWFIEQVSVKQGDDTLFTMQNGISLSEDPTIRFSYRSNGQTVSVEARDSRGTRFKHDFHADGSS